MTSLKEEIKWQYSDCTLASLKMWLEKWKERRSINRLWNGIDCEVRCVILEELVAEKEKKVCDESGKT
jgi:hypothetical protein